MKGKIVRGSGFGGLLRYILDKDKDARILGGNMLGRDAKSLRAALQKCRKAGIAEMGCSSFCVFLERFALKSLLPCFWVFFFSGYFLD